MNKTFSKSWVIILAVIYCFINFPDIKAQDIPDKYIIEYEYFEKQGENKSTFKLFRYGSKIKVWKKVKDSHNADVITTMYVYKDEGKSYLITESNGQKIGSKHNGAECSFIGMSWGIYILDLSDCDFFLQNATMAGSENILGKDCTDYNAMQSGNARTDYFVYKNNLTLKMTSPNTTIHATSYNDNPVFLPDEFSVPADVTYY